jgi:hypothetical protein
MTVQYCIPCVRRKIVLDSQTFLWCSIFLIKKLKKNHFIISALLSSEFIPLTQTMFWSIHEYRKWIHIYTNMCISTHSHKSLGIYIITESVHHIFCIRYFVLVSIDCLWYILYISINFIDIIIVSIHLSVKFSKHNTQHIHFV